MSETRSIGLASLKIGAIGADGGMGTVLAALGVTLQDSAELTQEDGEATEIYSEENDDAEEIILGKGKTTLKWSILDYEPDTLAEILGGTVTAGPPKVWNAPATAVNIEKSIEIISKNGVKFQIPRAKIRAKITAKFSKKGVAQVDITAQVMTPTKAATAPLEVTTVA